MPNLNGNYIDLIILVVISLYVMEGLERGFWVLIGDLVSFLGSLAIALRAYPFGAKFLIDNFTLPNSFANALGFVLVAMTSSFLLNLVMRKALLKLPESWWDRWWSKTASVVPAVLDGSILIAILLTLLVSLPVSPKVKADITDSKFGGFLVERTTSLERTLGDIFGGALEDTLTFLTIKPGSGERVDINFKPRELSVDEAAEQRMLELVNAERTKRGLKPLRVDRIIVAVARAHSTDMWERGYFAHVNPDGKDPFDRMRDGGVEFNAAGENLALAPTTELAHQGLMNSEGHRKNILDPEFGRIGIGVIDGGIYGKMFTQNFAD